MNYELDYEDGWTLGYKEYTESRFKGRETGSLTCESKFLRATSLFRAFESVSQWALAL